MKESSLFFPTLFLVSGVSLAIYSANLVAKELAVDPQEKPISRKNFVKIVEEKPNREQVKKPPIAKEVGDKINFNENVTDKIEKKNVELKRDSKPKPDKTGFNFVQKTACSPQFTFVFKKEMQFLESFDKQSRKLLAWLKKHPNKKIIVKGHADGKGNEMYNLRLSHRRAKKVANALKKRGVPRNQITIQAFGEYQPDADLKNELQRRVVVKIKDERPCEEKK